MNMTKKMKMKMNMTKNGNLIKEKLQEGDSFFYILPRFYFKNNKQHKSFHVFAFEYHKEYSDYFDENLMFDTEEKAYLKSLELTTLESY